MKSNIIAQVIFLVVTGAPVPAATPAALKSAKECHEVAKSATKRVYLLKKPEFCAFSRSFAPFGIDGVTAGAGAPASR